MTSTPPLPAQIEEAWRSIREVRGILYASKAADFARQNGKESTMTIGARSRLINLEAIFATLQQRERLEAVVEAARDLLRYAGIKHPGADNVIVSRERAHTLEDALAALDTAAPETPTDMSPSNSPERGDV